MVCLFWSFSVVVRDLSTFQISNKSILWGVVFLWPALYLLDLRMHLNFALIGICGIVLLFGLTSLIGMGDVKLILILAPWIRQGDLGFSIVLLIGIAWLQLIAMSLMQRRLPKRIAFAPAILLAAALNMAT
jgi:Flp pilus assembly protein protease CpaA